MTRDRAEQKLAELKVQARDMVNGFRVYKPMHMHMAQRVNDFLVLRPPHRMPEWAIRELHGYIEGMRDMLEREMSFAYEFDDGAVYTTDSVVYRELKPEWVHRNWIACGFVWPEPNWLGHYSWYTYTSREDHEQRNRKLKEEKEAKENE